MMKSRFVSDDVATLPRIVVISSARPCLGQTDPSPNNRIDAKTPRTTSIAM